MRIIVTTSDNYRHLLPVFIYLFNKYFPDQQVTVLGYDVPREKMPDNFSFVSMGKQGDVKEWSTDIRKWIEAQEECWFLWMMEDTLLKAPVNEGQFATACAFMWENVGRISLTKDLQNREHTVDNLNIVWAHPDSRYRLSTQPSIWNKVFLLQYLTEGLTPWDFETQDPVNDDWNILGLVDYPVVHNEGVTRRDRFKLDLNGLQQEDIDQIKLIAPWLK